MYEMITVHKWLWHNGKLRVNGSRIEDNNVHLEINEKEAATNQDDDPKCIIGEYG